MHDLFVFQVLDDQPDRDGNRVKLSGVSVAPVVPVVFDHLRAKTIGRVVRVWKETRRLLCALEFSSTPSGRCCEWDTRQGALTHVSPMLLLRPIDQSGQFIRRATIVEITVTAADGEPKIVRNVLLRSPATPMVRPTLREGFEANLWRNCDFASMQPWINERPVEAVGIRIDRRAMEWDDPVLESA